MRPLISDKARFALNNPAGRDHILPARPEAALSVATAFLMGLILGGIFS